jgi:hypothetical protein
VGYDWGLELGLGLGMVAIGPPGSLRNKEQDKDGFFLFFFFRGKNNTVTKYL